MATISPVDLDALRPRLLTAVEVAAAKTRAMIELAPGVFPMYTRRGRWGHEGELWTDWCAGFHAGRMWLLHRHTGDPWWRQQAEAHSRLIAHKQHDRAVHDLGFIFLNTYRPWFELTGDPEIERVLVTAGRTLALRFNPRGEYLCSFIGPESLFIDIMMNVPIIFDAARRTGDAALFDLARAHCRTTERTIVRPDGGTAHEGIFDPATGEFLRQSTHQGLSADSDWSRGLAWSLYGFGTVFTETRDPTDLAVAVRNADHFLERLPDSLVPPWDFDAPTPALPDSSAGAIAASGLLQLASLVGGPSGRRYRDAALGILRALLEPEFLTADDPEWEGTLKRAVYHIHKNLGVDESVMWGEFFFLEAVTKALAP